MVTQAGTELANFDSADQAFTNRQQGPAGRTTTTTTLIEEARILSSTEPFSGVPRQARPTGVPQSQK